MAKDDYSFMKSGFDLTQTPSDDDEKLVKDVGALVATYMDGAIRTAAKYLSHGGRKIITAEDIKRSLMLEVFFIHHRPDLLEKVRKIRAELFENNIDDEETCIDEDNYVVADDPADNFIENTCSCALCKCVNGIYSRWEAWTPQSPLDTILKKRITDM